MYYQHCLNWESEAKPRECGRFAQGGKIHKRLNEPQKGRITQALEQLSKEPPEGDIKSLTGRDGYRLRVGDYRVLFDIIDDEIAVHEIGLRGQIYKGRQ